MAAKTHSSSERVDEFTAREVPDGNATTVMLRNIPCRYMMEDLKMMLDEVGLADTYDSVDLRVQTRKA